LKEDLELKEWMSEEEEPVTKTTSELKQEQEKESNTQKMKEELMKEVEKRAHENCKGVQ